MKVLVQRVIRALVRVDNKIVGQIDKGLVLFVGFTENDNSNIIYYMVDKVSIEDRQPDLDEILDI